LAAAIRPALLFHDRVMATQLVTLVMRDQSGFVAIDLHDQADTFVVKRGSVEWPDGMDDRGDSLFTDGLFFASSPIMMKQQKIGVLYLASRSALYHSTLTTAQYATMLAFILAVILTMVLAYPLHARVTKPLSRLAQMLHRHSSEFAISGGGDDLQRDIRDVALLQRSLPRAAPIEVQLLLETAHYQMTQISLQWNAINRQQRALQLLNSHLEQEVQSRTTAYRQATERAEELARSRIRFLASMSHEIRTPMNAIVGLVQLALHEQEQLPLGVVDHLNTVVQASTQMQSVIDEILDFSKIDAGAMPIVVRPFSLQEMMASLDAMFRALATAKGLDFNLEYDEAVGTLLGDSVRIQQVLRNLINNAVKFTEQGSIAITVDVEAQGEEQLLLDVAVVDSGIGIGEEDLLRLFDPFTQADSGDQRRFGGTGLGLTISHQLTELMGGRLSCVSELGKGSVFRLQLPLAWSSEAVERSQGHTLSSDALLPLQGRRVLLVEDEPINRKLMLALLGRVGVQCVVAEDGAEAVEMAAQQRFDAILMDMQMPRMDGVEASREIRQMSACATTPIIATTANVMGDAQQRCIDAGMSVVICKPIHEQRLYIELLRWIVGVTPDMHTVDTEQADRPIRYDASVMLARLGGDRRLQQEVLHDFLAQHQQSGSRLQRLVEQGELVEAQRLAHNLAGLAGTLAAESLVMSARELLAALKEPAADLDVVLHHCCYQLQQLLDDVASSLNMEE
ncbi:MAG: ATP-binding protein, partial [Mariprofundales bacterium]|nr:ATP-binding protein [Mariprofundales bacterium]